MKFRIKVRDERGKEWWEDYDKSDVHDLQSAESKGRELVQYFNDTLRPYEVPRSFLFAELTSNGDAGVLNSAHESHEWDKTNLVTVLERGRMYDTAVCTKCGITAKRFGVGDHYRDPQYKAKAFQHCDTARELLARRALKTRREGKK
jgi:hypothetical protein